MPSPVLTLQAAPCPDGGSAAEGSGMIVAYDGTWSEWAAVAVAALFALYCFSYRDALGRHPWLYLLLGAVALLSGLRRLLDDILNIW